MIQFLRPETFDRLRWQSEIAHCARDARYLAATYLRFKAKDAMGRDVGRPYLTYNRVQNWLYEIAEDQWRRKGYVRLINGKVRQVGVTTFWRSIAFHQVAFHENRNALFVAHDEPSSLAVFAEYDKTWLQDLPPQMHPANRIRSTVKEDKYGLRQQPGKKDAMEFSTVRTRSIANHALNANVGASQMTHMLHYTEAGRVTRTADTVWASLQPSLSEAKSGPGGGFLQDHSIGVIESTSRFGGEWFKTVAEQAMKGAFGEWEFVWIPWTMLDAYSAPVPANFELLPDEIALKRSHPHVTLENLAWRRAVKSTYVTNPLDFYQEYAMSWEESWVLPRGTDRIFPPDVCDALRGKDDGRAIRPGLRFAVAPPTRDAPTGLIKMIGGELEVWALPEEGIFYDFGLDISGGATAGADWTVGEVVRRDTLEQVAEFRLHINPASAEFYDLVYWTGMAYNAAQINPDATAGWGFAILEELRRRGYPNIYVQRRWDATEDDLTERLGYVASSKSKPMLVTNAATMAYRNEVTIHSRVLLSPDPQSTEEGELETYLQIGTEAGGRGGIQWSAKPGCHDDAVSAWMLALISARDETGGVPEERGRISMDAPKPWEARPWAAMDIDGVYDEEERLGALARSGLGAWGER